MSFERNRAQLRCEEFLNCKSDLLKWNACEFDKYVLTKSEAEKLKIDLHEDAIDYYFKGLLSLFESINSINLSLFSWATVKGYYAVYYFLRSSFASKGYGLIRKRGLFLIKALEGEKPLRKGNKKYNSDHEGTINFYQDIFSNSDILLSNNINDKTSYLWLMGKRDQINYRERQFNEPNCSNFWEHIKLQVQKKSLSSLINNYIKDEFIYCFQEEHAVLAIPIKRALLTYKDLKTENFASLVAIEKLSVLEHVLAVSSLQTDLLKHLN